MSFNKTLHIFLLYCFFGSNMLLGQHIDMSQTNWTSSFFHYVNNYHFTDRNTGFFEDGRVARSTPLAPLLSCDALDSIEYSQAIGFSYHFQFDTLTLSFQNSEGEMLYRKFVYSKKDDVFASVHQYVYGREVLVAGPKKHKISW